MKAIEDRLNAVAKRLDELSEEGPSELLTLAEELGKIADDLPERVVSYDPARRPDSTPHWMRGIERAVQEAAVEIVAERYGNRDPYSPYVDLRMPNPHAQVGNHYRRMMDSSLALDPKAFLSITNTV